MPRVATSSGHGEKLLTWHGQSQGADDVFCCHLQSTAEGLAAQGCLPAELCCCCRQSLLLPVPAAALRALTSLKRALSPIGRQQDPLLARCKVLGTVALTSAGVVACPLMQTCRGAERESFETRWQLLGVFTGPEHT